MWLTNSHQNDLDNSNSDIAGLIQVYGYLIGEPRALGTYTVEELKNRGMRGVYDPNREDGESDPAPPQPTDAPDQTSPTATPEQWDYIRGASRHLIIVSESRESIGSMDRESDCVRVCLAVNACTALTDADLAGGVVSRAKVAALIAAAEATCHAWMNDDGMGELYGVSNLRDAMRALKEATK